MKYLTEVRRMETEEDESVMVHYILEGNRTGKELRHLDAIKLLVLRLRATFTRRQMGADSITEISSGKETVYAIDAVAHLAEHGTCEALLKAEPRFTPHQWRGFVIRTWHAYREANPSSTFQEFVFDLFGVPLGSRDKYLGSSEKGFYVAGLLVDVLNAAKQLQKPINHYSVYTIYGLTTAQHAKQLGTSVKVLRNMPESVVGLIRIEDYEDLYELCFAIEALSTRLFFDLSER